ncbi:MAG: chemotaxis protein CheA [Staphylothermus sp.]|nr:chemotaxis protein CheA [Staphylothermus sp.]
MSDSSKFVDKEFLEVFLDEASEFLDKLDYLLPKLEKEPENKEVINEIFRIMHSLKGNAAVLGLSDLSETAHKTEDLLDLVRKEKLEVNKEIISALFDVVSFISSYINALSADKKPELDKTSILEKLESLLGSVNEKSSGRSTVLGESVESYIKKLEDEARSALDFLREQIVSSDEGETSEKVEEERDMKHDGLEDKKENIEDAQLFVLNDVEKQRLAEAISKEYGLYVVTLKFRDPSLLVIRYFQALQKFGEVGDVIKAVPSGNEIAKKSTDTIKVLIGVKKLGDLEDAIKELNDISSYDVNKVSLEDLGVNKDELKIQEPVDRLSELENIFKKIEEADEEQAKPSESKADEAKKLEEVRVNVKSLDALFNLVGELVLIKSRLISIANQYDIQALKEALSTFERLVNELQNEIMQMRLVPLHYIFRRLPRIVSELSKKFNKDVDIYYEGGEIALDRKVLEELSVPLFKVVEILVRDDIEDSDTRIKKGKASIGTIRVHAFREGNRVIITVESDGKGLDPDEIAKRAVELGLIPPSSVEKMSNEEKLMLVTLPGFSLKNGELSGFDSIKHSVESIGGTLEIYSKMDTETRVTFKIPVSMATLRALLIKLGDQLYAIPVSAVVTTMKVDSVNMIGSVGVIKYQSKVITVYNLGEILGIPTRSTDKSYIVLIEKRGKLVGLQVDEILGQEDIVVKPLSKLLSNAKGFSGATILGDGKVCLIIDPISIL